MSVPVESNVLRDDLVRIMQDIFTTMLSMEIREDPTEGDPVGVGVVTASMHLGGNWNGAILLQCRLPTACRFTRLVRSELSMADSFGVVAHPIHAHAPPPML